MIKIRCGGEDFGDDRQTEWREEPGHHSGLRKCLL